MATKLHKLIITAHSPMVISQRRPGGIFLDSFDYIPGSTLRGASAAQFLDAHAQRHRNEHHALAVTDCDFCNLFLGETQVIFTNALPIAREGEIPHTLPRTAVSCKSLPGFRSDSKAHGVFDALVDRFCWESLQPPALVYSPTCKCGGRIDNYQTVYITDGLQNYYKRSVSQRLLTRVAIDRKRNVAADGLLYSPWVLSEYQHHEGEENYPLQFRATIYGASEALLSSIRTMKTIGGSGSRGLNHVSIEIGDAEVETSAIVRKRIADFNEYLQQRWSVFASLGNSQQFSGNYFTVNLLSDAILSQPDGRPSMVVDAEMLSRMTKNRLSPQRVKLVRSESVYCYRGGWHSAWKRPKPTDLCTERGSVFLFWIVSPLTDEEIEALTTLQIYGIGARTGEGYGQIRICDSFHLVTRDQPV